MMKSCGRSVSGHDESSYPGCDAGGNHGPEPFAAAIEIHPALGCWQSSAAPTQQLWPPHAVESHHCHTWAFTLHAAVMHSDCELADGACVRPSHCSPV